MSALPLLVAATSIFSAAHAIDFDFGADTNTMFREEDCPRVRQAFHTLSEDERMLYVKGFVELRKNGKLEQIATAHAANVAVHKGSSFFFLHAYMIWEAETAIRELGGDFACFSMPYWDYTMDSGLEHDPSIFHLNIGGNGDPSGDFCMTQSAVWGNTDIYWSIDADTCADGEQRNPPRCCLKRSVSDSQLLPSQAQIGSVFVANYNFLMFETQIDHYHVWPHFYLAVDTRSQMATAYAVDDPLFFLLHTFTLYQLDLWRTCYEYDQIPVYELGAFPDAYTASCNPNMLDCGVVGLDAPYNLYPLDEQDWALASQYEITPRMLFNPKIWNVQYDLGSFYYRSRLNEWCEDKAMHGDVAGPDPDLFVDITNGEDGNGDLLSSQRSNDLHNFIDETWDELKANQEELGMTMEEMFLAVESLSCKYHRENGLNSCWDAETMEELEVETCEHKGLGVEDELTLEQMMEMEGVKDNECLQRRRKQILSVSGFDDSIALKACNGLYDYQCPEWEHEEAEAVRERLVSQHLAKVTMAEEVRGGGKFGYQEMASLVALLCSVAVVMVCGTVVLAARACRGRGKKVSYVEDIVDEEAAAYGTF